VTRHFHIDCTDLSGRVELSVGYDSVGEMMFMSQTRLKSIEKFVSLLLLGLALASCDSTPAKPPQLVSAATLAPGTKGAVVPSDTPTSTPTIELPTETATNTPTDIVIILTATQTSPPSVSPLPSFTPTTLVSATWTTVFTATKRPTRTYTPTAPTSTYTPQPCTVNWFFSPRPYTCPLAAPVTGAAAFQKFERGAMIWFGPDKVIFTIYDQGKKPNWNHFPDEYADGMQDLDPSLVAPEGMAQPIRGFGLIWRTKPGLRDRVGWATGQETSYTAAYQVDTLGNRYLQGPTGEVYQLKADQSGWQISR
jgi:hypothetical protein